MASLIALLSALSCSDSSKQRTGDGGTTPGDDGQITTPTDGAGPPLTKTLTFLTPTAVDDNGSGKYSHIRQCKGKLGLAYFRTLVDPLKVTCPATFGQPAQDKPRPAQTVYYTQFDGTAWSTPVKIDDTIGPPFGLSLAFDGSCGPNVGYLGGIISQQECNSSDAIIASSSDGTSFSKQTKLAAGTIGDTVGHWMSLAADSGGQIHYAFRDVHYGFYEKDGNTKASLYYDAVKISQDIGAGVYASLVFDRGTTPVIAHYNPTVMGTGGGVQLFKKTGGSWSETPLVAGGVAEVPELATDGKGRVGYAYQDESKGSLYFKESTDLTNWQEAKVDRTTTVNGSYSSLAYDSFGNPGISYYRCNVAGKTTCDPAKDGLMFAYRNRGIWKTYEVDAGGSQKCGLYTSVTFDDKDQPVIAYQCVEFNNLTNEYVDTLKVIKGVYK